MITNTLPAGVTLLSASPTNIVFSQTGPDIVGPVGHFEVGASTNVTFTLMADNPGTYSIQTTVTGDVTDPNPANNTSRPVIRVGVPVAPFISISHSSDTLTMSWQAAATGFVLQSAESLVPPVTWAVVSGTITVSADQNVVTVPISSAMRFYRLAKP